MPPHILFVLTLLAAMGFTFAFTETYMANLRQKNDPINSATGACAAGFLAGVRSMSPWLYLYASNTYEIWDWQNVQSQQPLVVV